MKMDQKFFSKSRRWGLSYIINPSFKYRDNIRRLSAAEFGGFKEFSSLALVIIITYAAVLRFVFPGYLSPFWPHHADFYIPLDVAGGLSDLIKYVSWPRPIGMMFFAIIGNLGVQGAMAAIVALTLLNATLSVFLFRRLCKLEFNLTFLFASSLYGILLFSERGFYIFYAQDAFAQLSATFLMLGTLSYMLVQPHRQVSAMIIFFIFSLAAFFSKETYGLSAIALAATYAGLSRSRPLMVRIIPLSVIAASYGCAILSAILLKSTFVTGSKEGSLSPYWIDLSLGSVTRELWRYATDALNIASCSAIIITLLLFYIINKRGERQKTIIAIACLVAASLSWLPNAVLPNHHSLGYSWNGAYILFLPLLLLSELYTEIRSALGLVVVTLCIIVSTMLGDPATSNSLWVLQQEQTQRNLMKAFENAIDHIPLEGTTRVLITGLIGPFSPLSHPVAFARMLGEHRASITVITYGRSFITPTSLVHFLPSTSIDLESFDQVWGLRSDGSLRFDITSPPEDSSGSDDTFPTAKDYIIEPDLMDALPPKLSFVRLVKAPSQYLALGSTLLKYNNFAAAEKALQHCIVPGTSDPYVFFLLGKALEGQGKTKETFAIYQRAIELDGKTHKNPYFGEAEAFVRNMKK